MTLELTLGLERDYGRATLYGQTSLTQVRYNGGGRFGDTFATLTIGLRVPVGGDVAHAPDLPDIGRWVAYNANEIE